MGAIVAGDHKNAEVVEASLSVGQLAAIPLLAAGALKQDAAASVGVTPQTVSAWFSQPLFRSAIQAARQELSVAASKTLGDATEAAVETIVHLLRSGNSEVIRLKAACYVLDRVLAVGSVGKSHDDAIGPQINMHKLMEALGARVP